MFERYRLTPMHAFMRQRWERLKEFVDMASEESAAMFVDMLTLDVAYISQPMTPAEYDQMRESAQILGIHQAMFLDAGAIYDEQGGFQKATRMLVFGDSVQKLREQGLPLEEASWPYNATATEPMLPLVNAAEKADV